MSGILTLQNMDQLVLLKIRGKIVGRTLVQDYVFRPVECHQVSLYDWIRLSHIEKCPKNIAQDLFHDDIDGSKSDDEIDVNSNNEKDDLTFYSFLKDHPLHHTYHVALLDDMQEWVPNFIGGAIPRSDCGDREYYCLTMLTFFKPWRTGKDLKSEDQSWDDAFTSQMFNTRQLEVMKYFNVRYECLDARDDYAAQMKKDANVGIFSNWDIYDGLNSDINDHNSFEGDDFVCDIDNVIQDTIGPKTAKHNRDMLHIEQTMLDAGWFDKSPNGQPNAGNLTPVVPTQLQSGRDWIVIVQRKQELINERCKNILDNNDVTNKTSLNPEYFE